MKEFDTVNINGTTMTEKELDLRLESETQLQIRQAVRAMPEDTVSMSWRSELNEKLVAGIQAKQKKRRFAWILSPALGLGLAGALAVVMMTKTTSTVVDQPMSHQSALEESLVATHQDALRYTDVTGVGLNPDEVVSKRSATALYDFDEVALGSL
jgi:hypothetical protein